MYYQRSANIFIPSPKKIVIPIFLYHSSMSLSTYHIFCFSHRKFCWTMSLDNVCFKVYRWENSKSMVTLRLCFGVNRSGPNTSSITKYKCYRALGQLHGPCLRTTPRLHSILIIMCLFISSCMDREIFRYFFKSHICLICYTSCFSINTLFWNLKARLTHHSLLEMVIIRDGEISLCPSLKYVISCQDVSCFSITSSPSPTHVR
jgi:hypothetical protein